MNSTPIVSTETSATPDRVLVGILTGSPNDLPTVVKVLDTLTELDIKSEIVVASAHRTPDKVFAYLDRAHREGVQVSFFTSIHPPDFHTHSPRHGVLNWFVNVS